MPFLSFFVNNMQRTEFKDPIKDLPLILLAGGRSSRMGSPKGLLDYQGQPWLIEQLRRFKAASGKRAVVVLGFHQEQYFAKIPWLEKAVNQPIAQLGLEMLVAVNPMPEQGQFSSLQRAITFLQANYPSPSPQPSPTRGEGNRIPAFPWEGLRAGRDREGGGAFILPIDVPCPGKEVFEKLAEAFSHSMDAAIPRYQSRGGHPVLLGGEFLGRLTKVPLPSPLARLDLQIQALPVKRTAFVPVEDRSICLNMNVLDEFQDYSQREKESFQT
ncbi:MAG: NTP transferase domain-containing protein [Deltaproteobacteria bacterium]|nr:NTP transferase domain-containing protein [Deltaproteobacteria bacterium]